MASARGGGRPRLSGVHAVWALNAAIALACGLLLAGPVRHYAPVVPDTIPWWGIAAFIAITERWPVHLEFRRSAHSFSLTDIPVTLALLFLSGVEGPLAVALGGGVALALRRLPPLKFVFNLAQFTCAAAVGYVVMHMIAGHEPGFGPTVWVATLLALQIGGVFTIVALSCAMWLVEGSLSRDEIRQMFTMDAAVTATNTSLALVLAVIIVVEPAAAPILLIPIVIAFVAYRQYVAERQRHEKLQFLYEANRGLADSRDEVAHALVGLLRRALEAYRSEQAEVLLFSAEDDNPPLRTSLGAGDEEHMVPADPAGAQALRDLLAEHGRPLILEEPFPPSVRAYLTQRGIRHAMVAELRGEQRQVGLLVLANRTGFARRFTDDDVALFETLAGNASAALQYDRLEQAVSDLRDLQERLHHQAYHDPLTGLANRALFHQHVERAVATGRGTGVLFIDLDDFKAVNDTLGHAVGDRLLRAAARRLAGCVRGDDVVARLGGDEFAVLCMDDHDVEAIGVGIAERVLEAFQVPLAVAAHVLPVALSIGIATNRHSDGGVDPLLRDADLAMYQAKESGKGRFALFNPEMREALLGRMGLRAELEGAIANDALTVHFQPIFDMETGQTVAAEALVRWDHPTRGLLAPPSFIPLAEETGLIVPLGRRVLEHSCREGSAWADAGVPIDVHVNLSARELEDEALADTVAEVLNETDLAPARLVLEITESLLMRDPERGVTTLADLRALGVRLALDDFGTGYSSLSYLRTLPLDVLKIAKEFVVGIADNPEDAAFVRLIVDLADTIGLTVVAEGVETDTQLRTLQELRCDQGQGFLYAVPVPVSEWDTQGGRRALRERSFSDL
ncbi:MAG: EAL domain-containing protein [Thermoleophilia bacterium]|nr:EAL domain-containing protein [Thermoleophilia bacterium]